MCRIDVEPNVYSQTRDKKASTSPLEETERLKPNKNILFNIYRLRHLRNPVSQLCPSQLH